MLVEEWKATDQLAEEKDSLLEEVEEEQRATDQLVEEELIVVDEIQGEFVISVLGEVNMLLSIQPLVCETRVIRMSAVIAYICPQYCCKEIALCHMHLPEMFFCLFWSYTVGWILIA